MPEDDEEELLDEEELEEIQEKVEEGNEGEIFGSGGGGFDPSEEENSEDEEDEDEPVSEEENEEEEGNEESSLIESGTMEEMAEEEEGDEESSLIESGTMEEMAEEEEENEEGKEEGEDEENVSEESPKESEDEEDVNLIEGEGLEEEEDEEEDEEKRGVIKSKDSEEEIEEEDYEEIEYGDTYLDEVQQSYKVEADQVPAKIVIGDKDDEYVPIYFINRPEVSIGTEAFVDSVRQRVIENVELTRDEFTDADEIEKVKRKFSKEVRKQLDELLPDSDARAKEILVGNLIHDMVGLGDIEILLADPRLEELVINSADEPTWVYHQEHGWLKSNLTFEDEEEIYNYSSDIARRVGKNISSLDPLLDAHLPTGDRVNSTIQPISTQGNTITIRKFARDPWTIIDFIKNGTISREVAAFLWLCLQYELSVLVSGGTGAGKTSLLNVLMPFIPPSQRIISIEDTREVQLPEFLHWVPLTTREANPEGKGEISMLDLLVNSLRMRPDRILVGEIRKKRQAEVLFEAMHTGHSVYSTLHADTAEQTVQRLLNPPIDVAEQMVKSVDVNVVMFRERRRNFRRVFQVAEVSKSGYKRGGETQLGANVIYAWDSEEDEIKKERESSEIVEKLKLHTGMTRGEIFENVHEKEEVLQWLIDHDVTDVDDVGKIIAQYYSDEEKVKKMADNDEDPQDIVKQYE
ncbi:MAG: type II/IV secretion system ATPase subunit [Candidatus Nanohalobium sp.]